jgi:hypothetical protein
VPEPDALQALVPTDVVEMHVAPSYAACLPDAKRAAPLDAKPVSERIHVSPVFLRDSALASVLTRASQAWARYGSFPVSPQALFDAPVHAWAAHVPSSQVAPPTDSHGKSPLAALRVPHSCESESHSNELVRIRVPLAAQCVSAPASRLVRGVALPIVLVVPVLAVRLIDLFLPGVRYSSLALAPLALHSHSSDPYVPLPPRRAVRDSRKQVTPGRLAPFPGDASAPTSSLRGVHARQPAVPKSHAPEYHAVRRCKPPGLTRGLPPSCCTHCGSPCGSRSSPACCNNIVRLSSSRHKSRFRYSRIHS